MSSADERRKAFAQARNNNAAAFETAKRIKDPWYRAQALAEVARNGPEQEVELVVRHAIKAARETTDEYRYVAVSAWPLAASIIHGHKSSVAKLLPTILEASDCIGVVVNRSDALILVFEAVYKLGPKMFMPILSRLVDVQEPRAVGTVPVI